MYWNNKSSIQINQENTVATGNKALQGAQKHNVHGTETQLKPTTKNNLGGASLLHNFPGSDTPSRELHKEPGSELVAKTNIFRTEKKNQAFRAIGNTHKIQGSDDVVMDDIEVEYVAPTHAYSRFESREELGAVLIPEHFKDIGMFANLPIKRNLEYDYFDIEESQNMDIPSPDLLQHYSLHEKLEPFLGTIESSPILFRNFSLMPAPTPFKLIP
ncbi:hypothetical protein BB561_001242 [Smittium simulii]|uniref:Uncharacterized protein n=1 Tax=Smittium simulii TaxID=133385 RepID=A0A2T9YVM1_9FUNG|nr:hypothetical protein BB561_001242 [Smittium simulii]